MQKIIILACGFLFLPSFLSAQVISEIMYDYPGTDSKHEWVEIYNNSSGDIILSEFKFKESNVNHSVTPFIGGEVLSVGDYAVIADNAEQFMLDSPDFDGILFDSVFSLTNEGEVLSLTLGGVEVDSTSYTKDLGANGDGNSLQLHEDIFISALPTPGKENATSASDPEDSSDEKGEGGVNAEQISSHASQVTLTNEESPKEIKIGAGRERVALTDAYIKFDAVENNKGNKKARFTWIMGDGNVKRGQNIKYAYKNPGLYNVVLHARAGSSYAVSRTTVEVIEPAIDIFINNDFNLLIENKGSWEVNIGDFVIVSKDLNKESEFIFPIDTIISAKNKIVIDKDLLNFDLSESSFVELKNPIGHVISSIGQSVANTDQN